MMSPELKQCKFILPMALLLILSLISMSGCVSNISSSTTQQGMAAPSSSLSSEKARTIVVTPQLRETAVSREVGRWAVVVGISDYKYDTRWDPRKGIPDLEYADRDAQAFAEFLMSPQGGAFPPDRVILLTNEQATFKEMRKAIGDFLAGSLEEDIVIIYFAGHGSPDPRNSKNMYLICYDTEPDNYWGTAFPMWDINTAIERSIRSRRILVLADACHSAGVGGTRGGNVSDNFNQYMAQLAKSREGVTKITASRANELSMEREFPEGGHGLFTYYLLQALSGRGDHNQDGFVTMNEAYDYLSDKVRSDSHHSQNPWASPYVSTDIPLGIVDKVALYDIKVRQEAEAKEKRLQPVYQATPYPVAEIPEDSGIAIQLVMAKLAKKETGVALSMIDSVIKRQDTHKPEALAIKIRILLSQGRLRDAENSEDLLVIPYPDHDAALTGARAVYDHYLTTVSSADDQKKIETLETYIQRHPGRRLVPDAKKEQETVRAGIRTRYERSFNEQVSLVSGFINRNRFDRADEAFDKAASIADESRTRHGIVLETGVLDTLKASAGEARKSLEDFNRNQKFRKQKFDAHYARAQESFINKEYTTAYQSLNKAREFADTAQSSRISALEARYNAPPQVAIVLEKEVLDWEVPVTFRYRTSDKENDPVQVVSWSFGDGHNNSLDQPVYQYPRWSGSDNQRQYTVTLTVTDGHSTVKETKTVTVRQKLGPKAGDVMKESVTGMEFVWVPGGEFMMGSNDDNSDEKPVHKLRLDGFWMGKYEVTQGQWQKIMGNNPSHFEKGHDFPVETISWKDVKVFIKKLNSRTGRTFSLPSEAQWEYAARSGGKNQKYSGGDDVNRFAWYGKNSGGATHKVGTKAPNDLGIHDMTGNVWEWCEDIYAKDAYKKHSSNNPIYAQGGSDRVRRGGSWSDGPAYVRCAFRFRYPPDNGLNFLGFRLLRTN